MLKSVTSLTVVLVAAGGSWAMAQSHAGHHHGHGQTGANDAELSSRKIKALSDEQIADLRASKGMGYALAAELNGYPGPLHVLQLADPLNLSPVQRAEMQTQVDNMKRDARLLGEDVIALEAELDQLFATRTITPAMLDELAAQIGQKQAALRASHLKYHLSTVATLSREQIDLYKKLRGYK